MLATLYPVVFWVGKQASWQADCSHWPVQEPGPQKGLCIDLGGASGPYSQEPQQLTAGGPCCPGASAFIAPRQCVRGSQGGRAGPHCGPPGLQSQDCIAAALACSKILKELSKEEEDTDSSEEMLALADQFEHRAIGELSGALACGHTQLCVTPWGPRPRSQPLSVTLCHPEVLIPISIPLLPRLRGPLSDTVPVVATLLL